MRDIIIKNNQTNATGINRQSGSKNKLKGCPACYASGWADGPVQKKICPVCHGTGSVRV